MNRTDRDEVWAPPPKYVGEIKGKIWYTVYNLMNTLLEGYIGNGRNEEYSVDYNGIEF